MEDIIKLNVGGTLFITTRATLCAEAGSMLATKFNKDGDFAAPVTDQDGNVFLDRNPTYFGYILDYLRLGCTSLPCPPVDKNVLLALKMEADYLGLSGLVSICQVKISAPTIAPKPKVEQRIQTFSSTIKRERNNYEVGNDDLECQIRAWDRAGFVIQDVKVVPIVTVSGRHNVSEKSVITTVVLKRDD